jgi:hypothetical protein
LRAEEKKKKRRRWAGSAGMREGEGEGFWEFSFLNPF